MFFKRPAKDSVNNGKKWTVRPGNHQVYQTGVVDSHEIDGRQLPATFPRKELKQRLVC